VLSVATPDGMILARGTGVCDGVLVEDARGRGGFGYDPHFLVPELDRTFAELLPSEKNAVSHRARAGADLRRALSPLLR
jgi:XTP/dITP diphosphohydrolase